MEITKIVNGILKQICYVLAKDGEAIVIDPGLATDDIVGFLTKSKLQPKIVLLTHGHFDHIFSCKKLKDMGAKIYITEIDAPKLLDNELNMGFFYGFNPEKVLPDGFLTEGEHEFLGEKFEIVFTPGHTLGSCVIIYKDYIFTGDTYFEEGVYGRCDLLDGHQDLLEKSIEKLRPYLKGRKVFAGHL